MTLQAFGKAFLTWARIDNLKKIMTDLLEEHEESVDIGVGQSPIVKLVFADDIYG